MADLRDPLAGITEEIVAIWPLTDGTKVVVVLDDGQFVAHYRREKPGQPGDFVEYLMREPAIASLRVKVDRLIDLVLVNTEEMPGEVIQQNSNETAPRRVTFQYALAERPRLMV